VIARRVSGGGVVLMRYVQDQLTPLVVAGQDGPGGKWAPSAVITGFAGINQRGSVAFSTQITLGGRHTHGAFLWNAQSQNFVTVALAGTPAADDRVFRPVTFGHAAVNRHEEVAFGATIPNTAGQARRAIFFKGRDEKLLPVALPDQALPDGVRLTQAGGGALALTDAGVVAFTVHREGDPSLAFSACVWENGILSPVALVGGKTPGGDTVSTVSAVRVNNRDRSVLVALSLSKTPGQTGIYRWVDGQLTAAVVPGQEMPGGGRLQSVALTQTSGGPSAQYTVSHASEAGEYAFLAQLEDGSLGAYRLDAAGKLALILKSEATTELGRLTLLLDLNGRHLAINSHGQVALAVAIDGGPESVVLLTPTAP
jgi:hypothetical protein